ncbi:MAG: zinc ribbon domain-containing protein [Myxococcota bacterium]
MDCPQCGAEVPSDNAFCGKCGYAMRDEGVGRTDQSRIRMHEEPTPEPVPAAEDRPSRPSSPRIRKHTVLGMPPASLRPDAPDAPSEPPPPPPSSIATARAERRRAQKTMLGIPRLEMSEPPPPPVAEDDPSEEAGAPDTPTDGGAPGTRKRVHVRYDSILEPPSATARRRRLFVVGGVLVALSMGWLIYRFLNA